MPACFVTKSIHAYLDCPVAIGLIAMPFLFGLGEANVLAFLASVVIGIAQAEEIISELLETVTANAKTPLQLQKLEGDAALLYSEVTGLQDDAV